MSERKKFEEWLLSEGESQVALQRREDDTYNWYDVQVKWVAWQAARPSAPTSPTPPTVK